MKLLMLSDYSAHNKAVMEATLKNHLDYCCKWGIDSLYTIGPYSPHNNFHLLQSFMDYYDRIITVGTDILFTDMQKDIRDFCTNHFIVLQYNLPGPDTIDHLCNGDFIIWNSKFKYKIKELTDVDRRVRDSQRGIAFFRELPGNKELVNILPPRAIQSMCKWDCPQFEPYFWQPGDFSVHCYMCGKAPIPPDLKIKMLQEFKQEHSSLV